MNAENINPGYEALVQQEYEKGNEEALGFFGSIEQGDQEELLAKFALLENAYDNVS